MITGEKQDGKSFFSMALLDYLTNHDNDCLLVDSDILNPDVHTIYSKQVASVILDLSIHDGWIKLANLCESHSDQTVIINGTANGIEGIEKYSKTLLNYLFALKRHLVTFWIMSDDTRSLDTLVRYRKIMGRRIIHIVNNHKYDNNSFLLTKSQPQHQEFRHTGRIAALSKLPEETHESLTDEKITIKEFIDTPFNYHDVDGISYKMSRSSVTDELSQWRQDLADYVFKPLNYRIEDIINADGKSCYQTFTTRLADEIEAKLKSDYLEDFNALDPYPPSDRQSDDGEREDIGDLLAAGTVRIEDLAAAAAVCEELEEEDRLRLNRALEPETAEEYQERLQNEYRQGGNPSDFIASACDVRSRACQEYLAGGKPQNFIPTAAEIRERDLNEYHQGRPPAGFVPTQAEIDGIDQIFF
jgi:hypothetical protein